jgi:colanic acid biosynthesis glycosyl transferase WcaI
MKILIYSYNYHPEPIGIAPLMTELAEGLVKRGHEVRVVTGMPNYPERRIYEGYRGKLYMTEERNGVTLQRCYVWIRPQPGLIDRALLEISFVATSFFQALNGWKPDVIFLTIPPLPAAVPAAVLKWIFRCPLVVNLQDILPDAAVHTGLMSNQAMIKVFTWLEKFAYRFADRISVIADGFIDNLRDKGVPAQKLALISNWVDTDFIQPAPAGFNKDKNPFRIEYHLTGKFIVLYSGNIARTQGLETLIQAAMHLRNWPEIAIVIVGEGKARDELQALRDELGADNVTLLPFQPRALLPQMLAAADLGLVMQKGNVIAFNMPSKIQVLLASGLPIVASVPAIGTAAQAVRNSKGGRTLPPEDPEKLAQVIRELYESPETVAELSANARRFAIENYAFASALDRYEALFKSL